MTPEVRLTLESAARAIQQGRVAKAERLLRAGLEAHPGHPDLLHQLGMVAWSGGRQKDACQILAQAAEGSPDRWRLWYNLGFACYQSNFFEDAREAFQRALALNPEELAMVRSMLGAALLGLGANRDAVEVLQAAVAADPADVRIRFNLASALSSAGEQEKALAVLDQIEREHPEHPQVWSLRGLAEYRAGRFEAAQDAYDRELEQHPNRGELHYRIALIRRCTDPDDPRYQSARAALENPGSETDDRIALHFALAKMEDELDNPKAAFEHANQGNALKAGRVQFDPAALTGETDELIDRCSGEWFRGPGSDDRRPLLVVGMPRSGTTLLEQLLCRHPRIDTAGELIWFQRLRLRLSGPTQAPEDSEAQAYLNELAATCPSADRIIDKNPTNFRCLGLVVRLFPQATVIHVRRRPLETLRSIYFANLTHGKAWSTRLDWLGHYCAEYLRLMSHWREALPRGLIEIDYEDLVRQPQEILAELVQQLELEWTDDLMEPSGDAALSITTASAWQARQAVYQSSIDRGRAYAEHLEPALAVVRDAGHLV
jgi:Flp pilus assembly protein TadD